MRYSDDAIRLARQLKESGLPWQPSVGHFVWDGDHLIEHDSPFHGRIFFILDLKHFLRRSGTLERLAESMIWLPTWQQTRDLLRDRNIDDEAMAERLMSTRAIESGVELEELYKLLMASM